MVSVIMPIIDFSLSPTQLCYNAISASIIRCLGRLVIFLHFWI